MRVRTRTLKQVCAPPPSPGVGAVFPLSRVTEASFWEGFSPDTDSSGSSGDAHDPELIGFRGALLSSASRRERLTELQGLAWPCSLLQPGEGPGRGSALTRLGPPQLVSPREERFTLPEPYAAVCEAAG